MLEAIKPNRNKLEQDSASASAIGKLESILGDTQPYDRIKDLATAKDMVQRCLDAAIHAARDALKQSIDGCRDQLTPLCEDLGLGPDQNYKVKENLYQLYRRAPMESSLASLELLRTTQVYPAYDYAIKTLQDFREAKATEEAKAAEEAKKNGRSRSGRKTTKV